MRDAFVRRLMGLAENDRNIVLVTGDLGFGVLTEFQKRLPDQYVNAGVAEQNMTGLAVGLALSGKTVFTYSIANFPILRCLEQLRNDACYHQANVKVVAIGGGFSYGALGISHHATEDIGIVRSLPDVTVVVPGDLWEVSEATAAIAALDGTCYLRLDKSAAPETEPGKGGFQLGKARTVRAGSDITIIAAGGILGEALHAAEQLALERVDCRVLSMHTIKPLDDEAVFSACRETMGIVTVEENTVEAGLGGAVAEICMEAGVVPGWFHRVGLRAGFSSIVGSQGYLRSRYGIDSAAICDAIRKRVQRGLRAAR
jgi:transketolase